MSEAQTANAQGGRQASLWELRSSPVPGEAELGVPESEEFAEAEDGQRTRELTQSEKEWRRHLVVSTPDFNITSSLMHTQFAYATVNPDINSYSNNEPPNSQRQFTSESTQDCRMAVSPCMQARLLSWMA